MNTDIDTDILKTKSIIILKNVQRGEEMTGIIESVIYKNLTLTVHRTSIISFTNFN